MLYNAGDKFKLVYYRGRPLGSIFFEGNCVYPGEYDVDKYTSQLISGFIWKSMSSTYSASKILRSETPPPDGVTTYIISNLDTFNPEFWAGGCYPELLERYNDSHTYNVGDVVISPDSRVAYTCIKPVTEPMIFNYNYWKSGYYPELLEQYNSEHSYKLGDIILVDDNIYTCLQDIAVSEELTYENTISGYYPKYIGKYDSSKTYHIGDVMAVINAPGETHYTIYTAIMNNPPEFVSHNTHGWVYGYYPDIKGIYNISSRYYIGDTLYFPSDGVRTCISDIYPYESYSDKIVSYEPGISGIYTGLITYHFKDIVYYRVGSAQYNNAYTCIVEKTTPYNPNSVTIYAWYASGTVYWYSESEKVYAGSKLLLGRSISTDRSYYPVTTTDISGVTDFDTSPTTDLSYCFEHFRNLVDISPISNWNTSNVTNMSYCFYYCSRLTGVQALVNWNTSSVTNMKGLFYYCGRLSSLSGLDLWDISNVTNLEYALYHCEDLSDISALANWNTHNVMIMNYLFSWCSSLDDLIPLAQWDVSNVSQASYLFSATNVATLDGLELWDIQSLTDLYYMFSSCSRLTDLSAISNWDISVLTALTNTFSNCTALTDLTPLSIWNTSNLHTLNSTFSGCISLTTLSGLSTWNTSNLVSLNYTFNSCTRLTDISDISGWDFSSIQQLQSTFASCLNLTDLTQISAWDISGISSLVAVFNNCTSLTTLSGLSSWVVSNVSSMASLFAECTSLQDISDLSTWNVSNVVNMYRLFGSCPSLTDLTPITNWNISNVENVASMFSVCSSLVDLSPIHYWDVSSVTNMSYMFNNTAINTLAEIADWDTSNVTNMSGLFRNCIHLGNSGIAHITNWDVSNVTNFSEIFVATPITYVPQLNWTYTSAWIDISFAFRGCIHLTDISNLQNFPKKSYCTPTGLFAQCSSLTDISPLETWCSNAHSYNISYMFYGTNISDFHYIYDWYIDSWGMTYAFARTPITKFDLTRFTHANITTVGGTFHSCQYLTKCDLGYVDYIQLVENELTSSYFGLFEGCTNLDTLILRSYDVVTLGGTGIGTTTGIQWNFLYTKLRSASGKLYVPRNLIDQYKANSRWKTALLNSGCQVLALEGSQYENPGSL